MAARPVAATCRECGKDPIIVASTYRDADGFGLCLTCKRKTQGVPVAA